jgi:hypothetical protein
VQEERCVKRIINVEVASNSKSAIDSTATVSAMAARAEAKPDKKKIHRVA